MRVDAVKEQLAAGLADRYREFTVSSATVELAAQALQCEPGRIAKSLSVLLKEGPAIIVVMGTARLDNRKFKDRFRQKAAFIPGAELEQLVGAPAGRRLPPSPCRRASRSIWTRACGPSIRLSGRGRAQQRLGAPS